jgi:DNA repair exonuclease SbcCD nuclease subunit
LIYKIAHLADIHIRKSLDRHNEYRIIFDKLYKSLKKEKPDRIVIVGDIYDNFIDLEGEALILVADFLNNLSKIAKVIVTVGNHDIRKKHKSRINTIETVSTLINNSNIIYYNKSDFYEDDNIIWVVWDHVDEINPWLNFKTSKIKNKIYIDLYHNPVYGCSLYNGLKMENKKYPKINNFKGDYSFFGDIHLRQFFKNKTKAYCGSLIQQNFGESIDNHGYLLWDIKNKNIKEINIDNDYKFINISINKNTDYNNISIPYNKNSKIQVKVKWEDDSVNINTENERKIRKIIKDIVGTESIKIESNPLYTDISDSKLITENIDITDTQIQQNILKEFLINNNINNKDINEILDIDNIINSRLNIKKNLNIKWNIDKIWFNNFKSYGDNNIINWKDKDGIIQIHGNNQQGKSTILDAICYILYGNTLSTLKREKNGDNRFINLHRNLNYCDGGMNINIDGKKYTIYRKTIRKKKKNDEISSCSTQLEYYNGYKKLIKIKL